MTGKGHLIFGTITGIGLFHFLKIPFTPENIAISAATVVVSALAPDFDSPGSQIAKKATLSLSNNTLKILLIVFVALIAAASFFYGGVSLILALVAVVTTVVASRFMRENTPRKIFLACIGIAIILYGLHVSLNFLVALGAFVAIASWSPHRVLSHTIWSVAVWYYICLGLADFTHIPGLVWLGTAAFLSHLVADSLTKARVKWLWPLSNRVFGVPLIRVGAGNGEMVINTVFAIVMLVAIFGKQIIQYL